VSGNPPVHRSWIRELGPFLEIQNLGLNLPFALGFLLLAAHGLPSVRVLVLAAVAFIAARNAGHSFNRWADRELDRANPRTRGRALVTGRMTGGSALAMTGINAGILLGASYLLNPLAFLLSPVALTLILGYSYSKRAGWGTTVFLGLVQAITPAAAFIAVLGSLPSVALPAVLGMLAWGTAFEVIHSLGDVAPDREAGLSTIPVRFGPSRSSRLLPFLHSAALAGFAVTGLAVGLSFTYLVGLGVLGVLTAFVDRLVVRDPTVTALPFRLNMALGATFLVATILGVYLPGPAF
jgi:4-hydroxybenzoate polyprenyltransferase